MQHFDHALVLLRFDRHQRMTIQKAHNGAEGLDYWDLHYLDFLDVTITGNEVKCHVRTGLVYLALPFRSHIGLRSTMEFKDALQTRLREVANIEIDVQPFPPFEPVLRRPPRALDDHQLVDMELEPAPEDDQ